MKNVFEAITSEIIAAIEAGDLTYEMPWHAMGAQAAPANAISGRRYHGINSLLLAMKTRTSHFSSNRWATYRQWTATGGQVRRGEKATTILLWKSTSACSDEGLAKKDGGKPARPSRSIARSFTVFNADQVDGASIGTSTRLGANQRLSVADAFFDRFAPWIWTGSDSAFYDRSSDLVSMPAFATFRRAEGYYSVLAHELTHWSGSKDRLDRDLSGRFGSAAYAMEELIAELGSAFVAADLGLDLIPRRDHAPYVASWLKVLRDDPRAIVTAASKAQTAAGYLTEFAGRPAANEVQA
jgi:antirestriction protein ArdC